MLNHWSSKYPPKGNFHLGIVGVRLCCNGIMYFCWSLEHFFACICKVVDIENFEVSLEVSLPKWKFGITASL